MVDNIIIIIDNAQNLSQYKFEYSKTSINMYTLYCIGTYIDNISTNTVSVINNVR